MYLSSSRLVEFANWFGNHSFTTLWNKVSEIVRKAKLVSNLQKYKSNSKILSRRIIKDLMLASVTSKLHREIFLILMLKLLHKNVIKFGDSFVSFRLSSVSSVQEVMRAWNDLEKVAVCNFLYGRMDRHTLKLK